MNAYKEPDPWRFEPRGPVRWPTVGEAAFGPATDAVRRLIAQARRLPGPVHALLCEWRTFAWVDEETLVAAAFTLLHETGRFDAFWEAQEACARAGDAAGWWGGTLAPNGTSMPRMTFYWALLGTAVSDCLPPHAVAALRSTWDDSTPPPEISGEAIPVWCRLRLDGVHREQATAVVLAATYWPSQARADA